MSPRFVPLTETLYGDWDRFCLESDDAWLAQTTDYLDLNSQQRPELESRSRSFMIMEGQEILGIFPLIVETKDYHGKSVNEFSYGGFHGPTPALSNGLSLSRRNQLLKDGFQQVDKLAQEHDIVRISLRFWPLAPALVSSGLPADNYLVRYGFGDTSLASQVLDLAGSPDTILRGMTKGHRYDIKRGEKILKTMAYGQNSITRQDFDRYVALHEKASGRRTRPQSTFDMQYQWILEGKAALFGARLENDFVGFIYIDTYKDGAYFGSSCNDPEHSSLPITHVLQWRIIRWLKEQGYRHYELGPQQYGPQFQDFPSQKELDISLFKRGFGGQPVPLYCGEKFYSAEFYRLIAADRLEMYATALEQDTSANQANEENGLPGHQVEGAAS